MAYQNNMKMMEAEYNVCERLSQLKSFIYDVLNSLSLPKKCPFEAIKICNNQKSVNFSYIKKFLPLMVGVFRIENQMTHNNGNSCFVFEFNVFKNVT